MSQAYPQFTPGQILEAGQRAFSEGRMEYATQFFKHLIDHYTDTPEAATAREAMAQMNGNGLPPRRPQAQPYNGGARGPAGAQAAPGYPQQPSANGSLHGVQLGANGADGPPSDSARYGAQGAPSYASGGHAGNGVNGGVHSYEQSGYEPGSAGQNGQSQNGHGGYGQNGYAPHAGNPQQPGMAQQRPAAARNLDDAPHYPHPHNQQADQAHLAAEAATGYPAARELPERRTNYIIGRVLAGLLLLIGILGVFAGIVLVYGAVSDPSIFTGFGLSTPAEALMFAGAVFVGSLLALVVAQAATALFDGADAAADLSRLERYRAGDLDNE